MSNTIIIEDGSLTAYPGYIVGANSYTTVAQLQAYALARTYTLLSDPSYLLIKAMDYLETLKYIGVRKTKDQQLQWPRYDVWIDGWLVIVTTIPFELLNAQCEIAIAIDQGYDPMSLLPRNIERIKVGDIEVQYAQGTYALALPRTIARMLWKIVRGGGAGSASFIMGKG